MDQGGATCKGGQRGVVVFLAVSACITTNAISPKDARIRSYTLPALRWADPWQAIGVFVLTSDRASFQKKRRSVGGRQLSFML